MVRPYKTTSVNLCDTAIIIYTSNCYFILNACYVILPVSHITKHHLAITLMCFNNTLENRTVGPFPINNCYLFSARNKSNTHLASISLVGGQLNFTIFIILLYSGL